MFNRLPKTFSGLAYLIGLLSLMALQTTIKELADIPIAAAYGGIIPVAAKGSAIRL